MRGSISTARRQPAGMIAMLRGAITLVLALPAAALPVATAEAATPRNATAQATMAAAAAVAARPCSAAEVLAWVGLSGVAGSARGLGVPLEFSNIGRTACTISGYPAVLAVAQNGHQAAPGAGRQHGTHPRLVTLGPGQSAHAVLTIAVARSACRRPITAAGVLIRPPGRGAAQRIGLVFAVCSRQRTMTVSPVQAGIGIP